MATKEMLESGPSFDKRCVMNDQLVMRTIPLYSPKATRNGECIAAGGELSRQRAGEGRGHEAN